MHIDNIMEEWQKDCEIDEQHLDRASSRSPHLHAKYLQLLIGYKLKLAKVSHEISSMKSLKMKYFRGEMTSEELKQHGWEQWQYRSLKSDIDQLIEADDDMQKLASREQYIKSAIYMIEQILQEIKTRSFHIKNILEFQKFRAGA